MQRDLATVPDMPAASASEPMRPPRSEIGVIGWLRKNLFSSWGNALLTVVSALSSCCGSIDTHRQLGRSSMPCGAARTARPAAREGTGACWPFITAKFGQFIYGRYPDAERWRVNLVYALAVAGLVPLMIPQIPGKFLSAVYTLFVFPIIAFGCWSAAPEDPAPAC